MTNNENKIYTRSGDKGETSIIGGVRVAKDDIRIHVIGDIDELSSAIGLARAEQLLSSRDTLLRKVQTELIKIGTELAAADSYKIISNRIDAESIKKLEQEIDNLEANLPLLQCFILPGGKRSAAALHLARTICRRAERNAVTLSKTGTKVSEQILTYLNRLSDLLFTMARCEEVG
ncbi:MAG: cob(I)yrinic acid a,c-diamide adenosyltransferase [Planctomycetaceae bacterium]|jgi:cob(I)alamin adenosyltransferase|nr:cob(I)yrinic acid a,c-diamide adenosyltransferase [Planctomycetaceae bacterium]